MITRGALTGLILAGGKALRMQGAPAAFTSQPPDAPIDKGLLTLNGVSLLAIAQTFLQPQVSTVMVSTNRHSDVYALHGRVLRDDPQLGHGLGPLAGVERALAAMSTPWLIVVPVDVPRLPRDLIPRLTETLERSGAKLAYASTPERAHPLCMIAHVSLAADLRAYLVAGDRKVQLWQSRNGAVPVQFEDADQVFFNINTPQDLERAGKLPALKSDVLR